VRHFAKSFAPSSGKKKGIGREWEGERKAWRRGKEGGCSAGRATLGKSCP